jgi:hypothetical protein
MKTVSLIIIFFFSSVVASCIFFTNPCPEVDPYFKIEKVNLGYNHFPQPNRPSEPVLENEEVEFENFCLYLGFQSIYHSFNYPQPPGHLYALSCEQAGGAGSKVGLDTLYLVTLNDYDDKHFKNDTLNDILLYKEWVSSHSDLQKFKSIQHYFDENKDRIISEYASFKLINKPSRSGSTNSFDYLQAQKWRII